MATADYLLPVWPFMPNWRDGVLERLSWATPILASDTGAEQRFSTRISPRREFEVTFNPIDQVRTFFDLFVGRLGGQEMMIPLWHDRHKLTSKVTNGDTRINCNTEFGEFMPGGMALLVGADPWSHRAVRINTVDATGFTLVTVADFAWPNGGTILPLRRARFTEQPAMENLTCRVGEIPMRFLLNQANDLPSNGAWTGLTYEGYPVVTTSTNWAEPVEIGFNRITGIEDNGTGLAFIRDLADRAFRTKKHTWQLRGRQQNWEFRQFLYRLSGRRTPVWMPSGADDAFVRVQANAGSNFAQIGRIGLTYVGGPQPGRDRVLAKTTDGYQVRQITGMGAPAQPTYERINFNANLTYALPAGTRLQFLDIMRAEGDDIELLHHTDTEGVTECSINFRSFSNTRTAPSPIYVPTPSALISGAICGSPANTEDFCISFNTWTLRIAYLWGAAVNLASYPPLYGFPMPQAVTAGMMPNGRTIVKGASIHINAPGQVTRFVPEVGFNLTGVFDLDNPDGSPGGPAYGWRKIGPNNACTGFEYYFFFPISLDLADRIVAWSLQFGTGTFPNAESRVAYVSAVTGSGQTLAYFRRDTGNLWPYTIDWNY